MDYNSLVASKGTAGSLANWVNYSDAILPLSDIISDAQTFLWDHLRVHDMVSSGSFTIASGASTAAIPGGLNAAGGVLGVIIVLDSNNAEIRPRIARNVLFRQPLDSNQVIQQSWPLYYGIADGQFVFDCAASQDIPCRFLYWKQPAFLSVGAPTNFLTTRYPHVLRRACLMMAADFLNDREKYQSYMQLLIAEIEAMNVSNDTILEGLQVDADYTESRP